jgi:hypothetical protein
MANETTNEVAAQGPHFTVRFAKDAAGRMHAATFLAVEAPVKDVRKLRYWFQMMANDGWVKNTEGFSHERGQIFAFKSFQCRIPCFREGNVWFLTHGFIKKKDRWPEVEFERAERIRTEHLSRKGK